MWCCVLIYLQSISDESEDDFEVVPLDADGDDGDVWDVEDEDEDEVKQDKIRSMDRICSFVPAG